VSSTDEDRPIQLIACGKWIVVDDRYELATARWAKQLSARLGAVAISLRVVESEYALRRFDHGVLVGEIENEAAMKMALQHRIAGRAPTLADTRALDHDVHVQTAFLADLASGASRAKPSAGLRFSPSDSEDALVEIAKLAKLPQPLTRQDEPHGDLQLCFRRAPRAPRMTSSAPTTGPSLGSRV